MLIFRQLVLLCAGIALAHAADPVRLNCNLDELDVPEGLCRQRGCNWDEISDDSRIPPCYLDAEKVNYHLKAPAVARKDGLDATLSINPDAHLSLPFKPITELKFEVNYLTENIVRFRITDPAHARYEVPIGVAGIKIPAANPTKTNYEVSLKDKFNFSIKRANSNTTIFDTSLGGLIYSDRFLQITTKLPTSNVYGLGENFRRKFKHDFDYSTYPMFTKDYDYFGKLDREAYGVHAFYTVLENDGKAHGVFLLNSNAMAYTLLPTPGFSIKAIGGILDFLVFVGDNPEHVVQLYTSVIGRSVMPPFWGLGFQLCRFGYHDLAQVQRVVKRNLDNHVPIDVKYVDLDYADNWKIFTVDQKRFGGLGAYVNETKAKNNFRWAFIVDPGVAGNDPNYTAFTDGYKRDVFIKWPKTIPPAQRGHNAGAPTDKDVMYSKVWADAPWAFPDFFKNATRQWWIENLKEFHNKLNYDAIWLDMNEPATINATAFLNCPTGGLSKPLPSQRLFDDLNLKTICMDAVQGENGELLHYNVHSLFGWAETVPTSQAVHEATGKRGFLLSRATYAGSGRYTAHWLGDNYADWIHLRHSIIGILEFNLFGMSYSGVDICGFNGETFPELCRRWLQLGAYYPFSRNHNSNANKDQDPGYFTEIGHPEVTRSMVEAYTFRYQLLHYLYTLFYRSNLYGETVARPMHHEYPLDIASRSINEQYFLGPSVLVNPFLYPSQTIVKAYVPPKTEWYRLTSNFVESANIVDGGIEIAESSSSRPLLLRAGSVLPIVGAKHVPKPLNTHNIRASPLELWVLPNAAGSATGQLFYDDGESIGTIEKGLYNLYDFQLEACKLQIKATRVGYQPVSGSTDILKISSINFGASTKSLLPDAYHAEINGAVVNVTAAADSALIGTDLNLLELKQEQTITVSILNNHLKCIFGSQ